MRRSSTRVARCQLATAQRHDQRVAIPTEPNDPEFLQRIAARLDVIARLERHERENTWTLALPGSELHEDDLRAKPFRPSTIVGHGLALSLDALIGTRFIVQDPATATRLRMMMAAPYSTTRTALESAALSAWVLQPTGSDERVARALRAAWTDVGSDDKLARAFARRDADDSRDVTAAKQANLRASNSRSEELRSLIHSVATANGIDPAQVKRGLPGFGDLAADSAAMVGVDASAAAGVWHLMSGMTHPSQARSISVSAIESFNTWDPEVAHVVVTMRPDLLDTAISAALGLHLAVLDRVAQLGGNTTVKFDRSAQSTGA